MYDQGENPNIDVAYLGDLDLSAEMDKYVVEARTAERETSERAWNVNLAWYMSQPWWRIGYNGDIEMIAPEHRGEYFHVNILTPRVQTLVGNEMYVPKFEARPKASAQLEDVMRARAAADVANHAVIVSDTSSCIREAHQFKHIFGLCWLEVGWDQEAGPTGLAYGAVDCDQCGGLGAVQDPVVPGSLAPCTRCGAQGAIMGRPDLDTPPPGKMLAATGEEPEGDLSVWVRPPWEVYFDPNPFDPFKSRWLVHDADLDKTQAFNDFCKDVPGLTVDDLEDAQASDVLDRTMVSKLPMSNKFSPSRRNMTRVRRFYSLRTVKHPKGLYGVKVGGKLVIAGPLPYAHRKIPFVPLRCHTVPMKMYPQSTVDRLMPAAIFTNELMTKRYQRASQSVQLRMIAARGSAIDMSDIQGILEYDPKRGVAKPEFFNDQGASPDAGQMVDYLTQYADNVSYVQDVLRGESSGSQDNARFSALREQRAMNPLKMMIDDNSKTFSLLGKLLVETAKLYYKPHRVIRSIFGSHGFAKLQAFGTTPIGSCDDFELMAVRDIGRSLASRREELYEAKKSGVLDDPKLMRLAEFATEDGMYDETQVHQSSAVNEGERLRAGIQIEPAQKYENHEIHISSHTMLLAELRSTLGGQHQSVMELQQHIDTHEQMQAEEQYQLQMYQAQAAQAYGQANAANGQAQPQDTQQAAAAAGGPPAGSPADTVPQGQPSPPETQPALQQADQASRSPQQQ